MDKEMKKSTYVTIHIFRFAIVTLLLCIVMARSYLLYADKLSEILSKLEASSNDMKNMIWLYKHAIRIFPCIFIVLVQWIAYIPDKNKSLACRERKWQILIVSLYTFFSLFPSIRGDRALDQVSQSALWFATQLIPLIILSLYYSQRQHTVNEPTEVHPDGEVIPQE